MWVGDGLGSACEVDGGEGGFGSVEAVGSGEHGSDGGVGAFVSGVGDAGFPGVVDVVEPGRERFGEPDEWCESGVGGTVDPGFEEVDRVVEGERVVGEDSADGFFELVGEPDVAAVAGERGEGSLLGLGEVLLVGEEHESCTLELLRFGWVVAAHLLPGLAADFVEGFGGQGNGVERVETDFGVGCFGSDRGCVGGTEVHRDRFECCCAFVAELVEEVFEGFGGAVFGTPDHGAGVVINDKGQVLVASFPGDLIDTDADQPLKVVEVCGGGHDPLHHGRDGAPRDPTQHRYRCPVHRCRAPHDQVLHLAGEAGARPSEGNSLSAHSVGGTGHTAEIAFQRQRPTAHVEVPPPRRVGPAVIGTGGGVVAVGASQEPGSQRNDHHDRIGIEANRFHRGGLQSQETVECGRGAHGNPGS